MRYIHVIRDQSLITAGVLPLQKGGGAEKVVDILKGGGKKLPPIKKGKG